MAEKNNIKSLAGTVHKSIEKVTKVAELVSDAEEMEISRKEIEERAAAIGYMARAMTLATIPHKKLPDNVITYERQNGDYTLTLRADPKHGLPYGVIPRLLMSWVTMEAVRTQSPNLILGSTLSDFMTKLGYKPTGGSKGTIQLLRNQVKRLFTTAFSCTYENSNRGRTIHQTFIASKISDWWIPKNPNQMNLWESNIVLTQEFFQEIINRPVPISLESLANLRKSPLALDFYFWLTHRNFGHPSIGHIGIDSLQLQFGASYPLTYQGRRNFKKKILQAIKKVSDTYPEAGKLHFDDDVLVVPPGRPDVTQLPAHKGVKVPAAQQPQPQESPTTAPVAASVSSFAPVPAAAVDHQIAPRPAKETDTEAAARCREMQKSIAESKAKGIGTFIKAVECGSLPICAACLKPDSPA